MDFWKRTLLAGVGVGLLMTAGMLMADDDYDEYRKEKGERYEERSDRHMMRSKAMEKERRRGEDRQPSSATVSVKPGSKGEELYRQECSSCHMAYQPQFLPKRSWSKMMKSLADHFDTDASLDEEETRKITQYLMDNASDSPNGRRVHKDIRKIARSIPRDSTPLRISEAPYFKKEHREIPRKYVRQKEVKSFANCTACHRKAERGDYSERTLIIPNYGRWDD
ncbi:diheme cytochrome c [Nitratifractor sp.]